jgi:3-phosphoshikimate 1-carboxyvinyltransferase
MDQFVIERGQLRGELVVPPSKSQTLRAILFAAMAKGKSVIHHYLPSPDAEAMIKACRLLGAKISVFPERLEIEGLAGKIDRAEDVIDAGNSGIVLRFCAGLGALSSYPVVLTGDYSIRHHRPIQPLLNSLSQLGVRAKTMRADGYAPVILQGPIHRKKTVIVGEDSQPVSSLLIAGAFAEIPIEIEVRNPGEKPWVSLTLHWLDRLGIPYQNQKFERYQLQGQAKYDGFEYSVPGDWSSAAFPIAAALVTQSELLLKNIDVSDPQGDKELISIFQKMGGKIEIDEAKKTLQIKKTTALKGVSVDINNFVDGITILAVVGCFAEGETHIYNGAVTKQKECNRIQAIASELRKMGAKVAEHEDGLTVKKSALRGAEVHSYHDHRMAMSLAVAGMGAEGKTLISPVGCISKTFPSFARDFQTAGALIS